MKLERIPEYLTSAVVILLGIGFAMYSGKETGEGQASHILMILVALAAVLVLVRLRAKIWMLIPLCWPLGGSIGGVPVSIKELVVLYVFGCYLVLIALKIVRKKPSYGLLDILMFFNLLYLVSVFIRNPVGTLFFNSDRMGGRPYFGMVVSVLAYWVLVRVTLTPKNAFIFPLYVSIMSSVDGVIGTLTDHFPSLGPLISKIYTGGVVMGDTSGAEAEEGERLTYLTGLGNSMVDGLCAYFRPLTLLNPIHIFRFTGLIFGFCCMFAAGFRSGIFGMVLRMLVNSLMRKGWGDVVKMCLLAMPVLLTLILVQSTSSTILPLQAQRALSFLPGNWDPRSKEDAQASSEWRFEMWKQVWTTDKYIKNKWFGDGIGFTKEQLLATQSSQSLQGGPKEQQESMMVMGAYHSGPLSAVHIVGIVGLALYYVMMGYAAVYVWRLIQAAKGTPFFPITLMLGVPCLLHIPSFTFIFGGFEADLTGNIYMIGIFRMLDASLSGYKAQLKSESATLEAGNKGGAMQIGRNENGLRPALGGRT